MRAITNDSDYDVSGNLTKETDSKGNYKTYRYDGANNVIETASYDEDGACTLKSKYEDDDLGINLKQRTDYKASGSGFNVIKVVKYEYDALNKLTRYTEGNGTTTENEIVYNCDDFENRKK